MLGKIINLKNEMEQKEPNKVNYNYTLKELIKLIDLEHFENTCFPN